MRLDDESARGGDHSHFDYSGAKTSPADTHSYRFGLIGHDGPPSDGSGIRRK